VIEFLALFSQLGKNRSAKKEAENFRATYVLMEKTAQGCGTNRLLPEPLTF